MADQDDRPRRGQVRCVPIYGAPAPPPEFYEPEPEVTFMLMSVPAARSADELEKMGPSGLIQAIAELRKQFGLGLVERIWVHPGTAATFRSVFGVDVYDQNYQGVLLDVGCAGFLWGADVRTNESIPFGEVELVGLGAWDSPRNTWLSETVCSALWPADWDAVVLGA